MRNNLSIRLALFFFALFLIQACLKEKAISPESCGAELFSFQSDIQPIIETECALSNCHGENPYAPFQLLSYNQVDSAVRFYNLLRAIRHEGPNPMPRINPLLPEARKLPDSTLRKISCWIEQGILNN